MSNLCGASVLVWDHHIDGGLRVVNAESTASGDEFHQASGAVVLADIQGDGDAVAIWAGVDDAETGTTTARKSSKNYLVLKPMVALAATVHFFIFPSKTEPGFSQKSTIRQRSNRIPE